MTRMYRVIVSSSFLIVNLILEHLPGILDVVAQCKFDPLSFYLHEEAEKLKQHESA